MTTIKTLIGIASVTVFISCAKDKPVQSSVPTLNQTIPIPNGDFENWGGYGTPDNWSANSCCICLPAHNACIVAPDSNSYQGAYAARFVFNSLDVALAQNKFVLSIHPLNLLGYVKSDFTAADTVIIKINILHNTTVVDSGQWIGTSTISNYTQIVVPITQNASQNDSVEILIQGGKHSMATEFWVACLSLQ